MYVVGQKQVDRGSWRQREREDEHRNREKETDESTGTEKQKTNCVGEPATCMLCDRN